MKSSQGVYLTAKFIEKALTQKDQAGSQKQSKYKVVISALQKAENLDRWIKACTTCLSLLNHELISLILNLPLHSILLPDIIPKATVSTSTDIKSQDNPNSEDEVEPNYTRQEMEKMLVEYVNVLDDYVEFVLNLASLRPGKYTFLIFDLIIAKKFFVNSSPKALIDRLSDFPDDIQAVLSLYDRDTHSHFHPSCTFALPQTQLQNQIFTLSQYKEMRCQLMMLSLHELVARTVEIIPGSVKTLVDIIQSSCPTIYDSHMKGIQNYTSNSLLIGHFLPMLHVNIVNILFSYIVSLDLHASVSSDSKVDMNLSSGDELSFKSNTGTEEEDNDELVDDIEDDEDNTPKDQKVIILNAIISIFAAHLKESMNDELFHCIISNSQLLNSTQLRYSPALIFYLLTLKPDYFDWFVSFLLLNIFDGKNNSLYRLNCCCFLTIISRFQPSRTSQDELSSGENDDLPVTSFCLSPPPSPIIEKSKIDQKLTSSLSPSIDTKKFKRTVAQTLLLLSQYLHCCLDLRNVSCTFYHIINAIMYIFCFHHSSLVDTPDSNTLMKWWNIRGGFTRILAGKSGVLEKCLRDIVNVFLDICQNHCLFYYSSLPTYKQQYMKDETDEKADEDGGGLNDHGKLMDLFYFPFDPHILDLDIGDQLVDRYREWK